MDIYHELSEDPWYLLAYFLFVVVVEGQGGILP